MKEMILKEILKLPDGAFMEDEDVEKQSVEFQGTYKLLIAKRRYLEELLNQDNV